MNRREKDDTVCALQCDTAERFGHPHLSPAHLLALGNKNWYSFIQLKELKMNRFSSSTPGHQGEKMWSVWYIFSPRMVRSQVGETKKNLIATFERCDLGSGCWGCMAN